MKEQKSAVALPSNQDGALEATNASAEGRGISIGKRNLVLGIVNASHVFNHMQSSMVSILYPVMMQQLGFGYFQIGVLQTIYQLSAMGFQVVYGVLARFLPRAVLLGIGSVICGTFYAATGLAQNFAQVGVMRGLSGLGSSAQHPVGSATWSLIFKKRAAGFSPCITPRET